MNIVYYANKTRFFIVGMLADKFRQYKLFLIGLVAISATCHTMLLFVDAKILPDGYEILTEMKCSPTGTSLRFTIPPNMNTSCNNLAENNNNKNLLWATFLPTDCQLINCSTSIKEEEIREEIMIEMCNHQDNNNSYCNKILMNSQTKLDMTSFEIVLDYYYLNEEENCTAQIVANCQPCSVQCPMKMKLKSKDEKEIEDAENQKENDRKRHQRGFWIYFLFRIIASSSLAAAFSMFVFV